ncbi:hypothetical protein [Shewanella gaetbuli]
MKNIQQNEIDKSANLQALLSTLPKEIEPNKDLWQGIEAQINKPNSSVKPANRLQKWKPIALAASVVMVMLFSWSNINSDPNIETAQVTVESALQRQSTTDLLALIDTIALAHQQQIEGLQSSTTLVVLSDNGQVSSGPFNQGLQELKAASQQIQQALKADPNNKSMWDMWQWIMQREMTLLQRQQKSPINQNQSFQGNQI